MNQLEKILENKRAEVEEFRRTVSLDYLKSAASIRARPPDFLDSLRSKPMGLIAEIKRKSPSAGAIRPDLRPNHLAEQYEAGGAQAISILMDRKYFGGEESDFIMCRDSVHIPILYKEFVLFGYQVWHAAALGASAVLFIAAALTDEELVELIECAVSARLTPLVEVHTIEEMKRVAALQAPCIGINNRDLTTFQVSLDTTLSLIDHAPAEAFIISESGIQSPEDVHRLYQAGARAVLVGEHLLKQVEIQAAIQDLMGTVWASS